MLDHSLTYKTRVHRHAFDGGVQDFFSVDIYLGAEAFHTNWMTPVNGELHDCMYGIDDDTYDGERIPTSPLVNFPKTSCNKLDQILESRIDEVKSILTREIFNLTCIDVDVPFLCESDEFDQVCELKKVKGFDFCQESAEFFPHHVKEH